MSGLCWDGLEARSGKLQLSLTREATPAGCWRLRCDALGLDGVRVAPNEAALPLAQHSAVETCRFRLQLLQEALGASPSAEIPPARTPHPAIRPSGPLPAEESGRGSLLEADGPGAHQAGVGLGGASSLSAEEAR